MSPGDLSYVERRMQTRCLKSNGPEEVRMRGWGREFQHHTERESQGMRDRERERERERDGRDGVCRWPL